MADNILKAPGSFFVNVSVTIYSNNGNLITEWNYNGAEFSYNWNILSTGIIHVDGDNESWTYNDTGRFLGFSKTANSNNVDFPIGYTTEYSDFEFDDTVIGGGDQLNLYVVVDESPQITDLTGAKLKFLDVTNLENGTWQINFKSNNKSYSKLEIAEYSVPEYSITYVNNTTIDTSNAPTTIKAGETIEYEFSNGNELGGVYISEYSGADVELTYTNDPFFVSIIYTLTISNPTSDVTITLESGKGAPPLVE